MSIYRISSNTIPDNGIHHTLNRQYEMEKTENQLSTGKKFRLPRESTTEIAQAMTFHTKIHKIDQYMKNIEDANGEMSIAENKIMDTVNALQKVRELAVQMSNGVYSEEERKMAAVEVDQILRSIILDSNQKYKGNFLFSGFQKYTKPFETIEGAVKGIDQAMITQVRYLGDNGKHLREIDMGEYVSGVMPGSEVFWGEQFQIYSNVNTADFRLTNDSSIMIDGKKIDFNAGDNIYGIVDKINQAPVAVRASLDIVTGGLIIKSTNPHKVELSDIEGGTLLQNLGILQPDHPTGPDNYNVDAMVFGGSVFDVVIGLRDSMIANNAEDIGGRYLGAIDLAIGNLLYHTAETGALSNRLTNLSDRLTIDKESYTTSLSQLEDVNVAETLTELNMLEFAHKVALSSLAKTSQVTLMDFLR